MAKKTAWYVRRLVFSADSENGHRTGTRCRHHTETDEAIEINYPSIVNLKFRLFPELMRHCKEDFNTELGVARLKQHLSFMVIRLTSVYEEWMF